MQYSELIYNLKYRIAAKGDVLIEKSGGGSLNDIEQHSFIVCVNVFDFVNTYSPGETYTKDILVLYENSLLVLNKYLETNLYYDYI